MRNWIVACGAAVLAFTLGGCGGGGGGAGNLASGAVTTVGRVTGEVRDANGLTVAGATLTVRGTGISLLTDADGYFLLQNVPTGNQIIDVTSNTVVVSKTVTVLANQTVSVGTLSVTGTGGTGGGTGGGGTGGGVSPNSPPPPPF